MKLDLPLRLEARVLDTAEWFEGVPWQLRGEVAGAQDQPPFDSGSIRDRGHDHDPRPNPGRPPIDPRSTANRREIRSLGSPQIQVGSTQARRGIHLGPTPDRPRLDLGPATDRPRIGPRSTLAPPDPKSALDRPRIDA